MARKAGWNLIVVVFVAACSRPADYKAALVLTDDASKHCDDSLSAVAYLWKDFGVDLVEEYYQKATEMKPIDVRLGQARAVLGKLSKGQERDLLFEHYAAADKLCGLVRSAEGYSLLTFSQRRSDLRDELAESRAKLSVLVPVTDAERAAILAENADPFKEEERQSKRAAAYEANAEAKRRQQEAAEAARRAAEREAFDDAERARLDLERVKEEGEAEARGLQEEDARREAEPTAPRQKAEPSKTASSETNAWFDRAYPDADRFCSTAATFAQDLQASRFAKYKECAVLADSISLLRSRLAGGPPEIATLAATILDSYERGAAACLKRGDLATVGAFNEGQRACSNLRLRLRKYGLLSR